MSKDGGRWSLGCISLGVMQRASRLEGAISAGSLGIFSQWNLGSFPLQPRPRVEVCTSTSGHGDIRTYEQSLTGRSLSDPLLDFSLWGSAMLGEKKFYRSQDNSECDGRP